MTWDEYQAKFTDKEYAVVLAEHIDKKFPGVPSTYKYRQIVSMGGTRSSKSYSILQLLLIELMGRDNIKITVWRNLKNICRSTVLEDFQKIIAYDKAIFLDFKYNKQEGSFVYTPTGSRIVFEGADSVGKVLGGAQDISFFNEVTEFSEEVYLQITQRTADRVFCDYNPSKDFWLEAYRNNKRSKFIHSSFLNNYFCPANIVEQILSYEPWETGSYEVNGTEIYYNGNPIGHQNQPPPHIENIRNGTGDEYMWMVYGLGLGAEKPNKIYKGWNVIDDEFFEGLEYPSYFGLDFGAVNATACIEVKYGGDGDFYLRERLYQPLSEISDSLPTIIQHKVPQIDKGNSLIVGDSAKKAYINLLATEGHNIVSATKGAGSVEVGITLVQGFTIYYVWTENLKKEYDSYSWMVDRYGKATDVPEKSDDHLMDAMRYIISYLVRQLDIKV